MYYAAYGSNINLEQMAYRCPNSRVVGVAYVRGYQLVFNTHADIIPLKGSTVAVLLWEVDDADWRSLDRYEGYPKYYIKQTITAELEDSSTEECIAYVMAKDRKGFEMPYKTYYDGIAIGYMENNIPLDYLDDGLNYTYEKIKEGRIDLLRRFLKSN